ncbi:surfactin synthase thioesterase subunit [Rhodococcus sp. 27YEA15]|uniref:thioesterase II family protein n=1 Tax=Rhodococcus sp. 27YEA15 TaxID=3156259 RepID=UPI003C7CF797
MTPYLDRVPAPTDPIRLFCFHQAGAGASTYAGWVDEPGPDIAVYPVQLPGRESRKKDSPITDFAALIDELDDSISPWLDVPYAFYGHSMGAAVAASLTRRQAHRDRRLPQTLFVGAYPGDQYAPPMSVADLTDDDVADLLVGIGGMSAVVRRYPDWTKAAVDLLRADLDALHSRVIPAAPDPLDVPIRAYAGSDDHLVDVHDIAEWSRSTTNSFELEVFPGGHFFLHDSGRALRSDISRTLHAVRDHARNT